MPIMQPDLPTRAWQKLGTDIFDYDGKQYLIVTDYYRLLLPSSVTLLDDTLPSPSELLFGRKPKFFLPSAKRGRNETNDRHIEANDRRQEAQRSTTEQELTNSRYIWAKR